MNEQTRSRGRTLAGFFVRLAGFLIVLCAVLTYTAYVLTPKEEYGICPMTNLYAQPRDTVDLLVTGTSLGYSACNTNVLWRAFGIASYNLCGAEQPFWETYYLLREALTLQHPRVIVLDAKAATYTLDYSTRARTIQHTFGILHPIHRIEAIVGCQESLRAAMDFVWAFPQIHNRYPSVGWEDFIWPPSNQGRGSSWKGFIETDGVDPHGRAFGYSHNKKPLVPRAEEYVRKILEMVQKENIPILLVAFPSPNYDNDAVYFDALWRIAEEYGVPYIDYNDPAWYIGLDYAMDFADWEHLNIRGGIKMSYRLGNDLGKYYSLPDHRQDPAYESYEVCAEQWMKKLYSFASSPSPGDYPL